MWDVFNESLLFIKDKLLLGYEFLPTLIKYRMSESALAYNNNLKNLKKLILRLMSDDTDGTQLAISNVSIVCYIG